MFSREFGRMAPVAKSFPILLIITGFFWSLPAAAQVSIKSPSPVWSGLMNANIASEYVATELPMTKSGCPLIGYVRFFPSGILKGMIINDMARSKANFFSGKYNIANSMDIKFTSDNPLVPLSNMNGKITFATVINSKNPPLERLILTTATAGCNAQTYRFTLTDEDE